MKPVEIIEPKCPLVLAMPHSGTYVPEDIRAHLNEAGQTLSDTDWHIDRLYAALLPDAGVVKANFHRYVIDANRNPENVSLYPGQNTTALCPVTDFAGQPIWRDGAEPDEQEIARRLQQFYTPYHNALSAMLEQVRERYGYAILYDCHSIRSQLPFLFEGELPVLNIGTNDGKSCAAQIENIAVDICKASGFSTVLNGRFKGGWTTRYYGRPAENIHAIQMEIAQCAYMQEQEPWAYQQEKAERLRADLKKLLSALHDLSL